MTKRLDERALVIPPGVRIHAGNDGFTIGNLGDVVIHGKLSIALKRLFSEDGSVDLRTEEPVTLEQIDAPHGEVRISGPVDVRRLFGQKILFESGELKAGSMVAEQGITVKGTSLQADFIVSPSVEIDAGIKGRATVIEAQNDLGPHRLKGGFRLDEYLELFPSGEQILEQYPDVKAYLDKTKAGKPEEATEEATEAEDETADEDGEEIEELKPASIGDVTSPGEPEGEVLTLTDAVHTAPGRPIGGTEPMTLETREPEELVQESTDELYQRLSECYLKIMSCYADVQLPPPLQTLESLLEERRFADLKKQITSLWNELLQYHKREGLNIAHAVTHNVQKMKQLLQEAV